MKIYVKKYRSVLNMQQKSDTDGLIILIKMAIIFIDDFIYTSEYKILIKRERKGGRKD